MLDRTMADGLSFWFPALDSGVGQSLREAGEFARPEVDLLAELFARDPQAAFIDVGANIGVVSLALARRFPTARVTAFEAHPGIHRILCANVVANGLLNVNAVHCAVGAASGVAQFPTPALSEQRNFGSTGYASTAPHTPVLAATLDQLFPGDRVAVLKIDVEGMEGAVLRGAEQLVSSAKPALFFEVKADAARIANVGLCMRWGYDFAWFLSPFITPANAKGRSVDQLVYDMNVLGLPAGTAFPWDLPRFSDPAEHWQDRLAEMRYLNRYGIYL